MEASSHEVILIEGLKEGNVRIYDYLFQYYYSGLVVFAQKYIPEKVLAEDIVQEFFIKLWTNRANFHIETTLKSYFFTSIKNRCIDHIRHEIVKGKAKEHLLANAQLHANERDYLIESELMEQINLAIGKLPEVCREIFILNRFEGMKPSEIAKKRGISVRTVETHIGKALKILRKELSGYLPASIVMIILGTM